MRIVIHRSIWVDTTRPTRYKLMLNKREQATLDRADAIIEEARERIRDHMGEGAFDLSRWYTLDLHDLAGEVGWDDYDRDEDKV